MIKYIDDLNKYVKISGFRGISVQNKEKLLETVRKGKADLAIQFFDAGLVCTWEHLYFAVLDALMAFRNHSNLSKSLDMEMLLYASAQRQITKAIKALGIRNEICDIASVVISSNGQSVENCVSNITSLLKSPPDDSVLELTESKISRIMKVFQITELEISSVLRGYDRNQALVDLIIERMALLPTQI